MVVPFLFLNPYKISFYARHITLPTKSFGSILYQKLFDSYSGAKSSVPLPAWQHPLQLSVLLGLTRCSSIASSLPKGRGCSLIPFKSKQPCFAGRKRTSKKRRLDQDLLSGKCSLPLSLSIMVWHLFSFSILSHPYVYGPHDAVIFIIVRSSYHLWLWRLNKLINRSPSTNRHTTTIPYPQVSSNKIGKNLSSFYSELVNISFLKVHFLSFFPSVGVGVLSQVRSIKLDSTRY
jgi:hypothetical protein